MSEKIVVHMNKKRETVFLISDPQSPDQSLFASVGRIHDLTPYGMLLASLGSCTGLVLFEYAEHHQIDLQEVDITLTYDRQFKEDCDNCERISEFNEHIQEDMVFNGNLSNKDAERLLQVAHYCPIYKMLQKGTRIASSVRGIGEKREEEMKRL